MASKQGLENYFNYQTLTEEQIRFYEEQGYLLLSQTLNAKGLALFREQCMEG